MSDIVGKKGDELSSGYVWVPYVMAYNTPIIMEDFKQKRIRKIRKILENG